MKFVPKRLTETDDASRGLATRKTFFKEALGVLLFLVAAYVVLGWLGILLAEWIPDAWERRLGDATAAFDSEHSSEELARVQPILDRLVAGESMRELDYRLFLFDSPDPNAIAVPGGSIGISSSLMDVVETEIGLAFVVAHELGHHQNRHTLRALGRMLLLHTVAAMFGSSRNLLGSALEVSESGFSRKQEREADEFALGLVYRKYGTTRGVFEFFNWVAANGDEMHLQKYLGTHPLSEDRTSSLEALAKSLDRGQVE